MSFKMPVGKELDDLLDQLTPKDIEQIRSGFEFDVQKENIHRKKDHAISPLIFIKGFPCILDEA